MTTIGNIDLLLRSISMVDLLAHFGKRVDHVRYMYFSPFRDEDQPSMRVRNKDGMDIWVDYGADLTDDDRRANRKFHGGGLIDMAMELGNLNKKEAIELLKSIKPGISLDQLSPSTQVSLAKRKNNDQLGSIVIESVSDNFTNRSLINYSENERFIPVDVLSLYCKQVRYHVRSNPKRSFVKIGFPNNDGGWTLRGSKGKIASSSMISTFDTSGKLTSVPSSQRAFVFEGFFDFLSWISWNGGGLPKADACILNSVSNLPRALEWLSSHKELALCFDNDQAGRKAVDKVREHCKNSIIKDCSDIYSKYNDLNDCYANRCRLRRMEVSPSSPEPPSKGIKI